MLVIVVVMAAAVVAGVVEPPRVAGGNVTVAVVVAVAFVPSLDLETHLEQKKGIFEKRQNETKKWVDCDSGKSHDYKTFNVIKCESSTTSFTVPLYLLHHH